MLYHSNTIFPMQKHKLLHYMKEEPFSACGALQLPEPKKLRQKVGLGFRVLGLRV